jgi:uncharacterized protein (DUF433 family)
MTRIDYQKIITRDPLIKNGEPCIRGLPITVAEIMSRVATRTPLQQIMVEHPELTREDFMACAAFIADQPFGTYLY